jgi:hypothetical protein
MALSSVEQHNNSIRLFFAHKSYYILSMGRTTMRWFEHFLSAWAVMVPEKSHHRIYCPNESFNLIPHEFKVSPTYRPRFPKRRLL